MHEARCKIVSSPRTHVVRNSGVVGEHPTVVVLLRKTRWPPLPICHLSAPHMSTRPLPSPSCHPLLKHLLLRQHTSTKSSSTTTTSPAVPSAVSWCPGRVRHPNCIATSSGATAVSVVSLPATRPGLSSVAPSSWITSSVSSPETMLTLHCPRTSSKRMRTPSCASGAALVCMPSTLLADLHTLLCLAELVPIPTSCIVVSCNVLPSLYRLKEKDCLKR